MDSLATSVRFTRAARAGFHNATAALEECFAQGAAFAKRMKTIPISPAGIFGV